MAVDLEAGETDTGAVTLYPVQSATSLLIFPGNLSGATAAVDVRLPEGVSAGDGASACFGRTVPPSTSVPTTMAMRHPGG